MYRHKLLEDIVSVVGEYTIVNRTTAVVRLHISCCANVHQLLCGKFIYRNASAFFVYVANLFISFCFQRTSYLSGQYAYCILSAISGENRQEYLKLLPNFKKMSSLCNIVLDNPLYSNPQKRKC